MASMQPSLDSIINVKVAYDGVTRRAKMPLRDAVPRVLPEQIRAFLHIPADADIILERYSDSAGGYITLEPGNSSVYKQLYRAAKAKSKLKLRVTLKDQEEAVVPKPVTVEDVQEDSTTAPSPSSSSDERPEADKKASEPPIVPDVAPVRLPPMSVPNWPAMSRTYESSDLSEAAKIASPADFRREFQDRVSGLGPQMGGYKRADGTYSAVTFNEYSMPPAECPRFAICCNSCEETAPDVHYHCSTCDDGDFDLCQSCVDKGITCYGSDHWLIKRTKVDGQIVTSTTETIAPKPKPEAKVQREAEGQAEAAVRTEDFLPSLSSFDAAAALANLQENLAKLELNTARLGRPSMRTCNSCIQELPEAEFLHCGDCEDYDLCRDCFSKEVHGHHPMHTFAPAVGGTVLPDRIIAKLAPGRNQVHHAICDGCDKFITGVRHKCLNCPDWDYCNECIANAETSHPSHRFAPIYEPLRSSMRTACPATEAIHVGICCDGPLCATGMGYPAYIHGIRYKCAVCHDVDFCANCEAYPKNTHNKSHPLVKFRSPVRHVSVTTHGEHSDGQKMPIMGDRHAPQQLASPLSINTPRTVVDTEPRAPAAAAPVKEEKESVQPVSGVPAKGEDSNNLRAVFLREHIRDGTIMSPNQEFEQTWVLRNDGKTWWPAGCSVKFVGGDYMGHLDSSRPARTAELVEASASDVCYAPVAPGQEFSFTVKLRTPPRPGRVVSYWRPTTPDGSKFGDRLWCEVNVRNVTPDFAAKTSRNSPEPKKETKEEEAEVKQAKRDGQDEETEIKSSQMIFPKLEKESPMASVHQELPGSPSQPDEKPAVAEDDFEDCGKADEWDGSDDDDFLTDEEYDILDASDEEFLEEQKKNLAK